MSAPTLIATVPQTPQSPPPAAVQLIRAGLEALSARLGQTLPATVLGTDANGVTQLKLGDLTIAVKLSQPLPPGTQLQVTVQPTATGTPTLVVQPAVAVPATPAPALPTQTLATIPLPAVTVPQGGPLPGPVVPLPSVATPATPATVGQPTPSVPVAPAVATTAAPPPVMASAVPVASGAPQPAGGLPAGAPASALPAATPAAGVPTPPAPVSQVATMPSISTSAAAPTVASPPAAGVAAAAPASGAPPLPTAPAPTGSAIVSPVANAATPQGSPTPAPTVLTTNPAIAPGAATAAYTAGATPVAPVSPAPLSPAAATMVAALSTPATTAPSAPGVVQTAPIATAANAPIPVAATPTPAPTAPYPTIAASSPATTAATAAQPTPQTVVNQRPGTASASAAPAARPAAALAMTLAQPAQAAARQDSMAPLLQTLGAMQGKLGSLPQPVAAAAMQLLAQRIPLDRGGPSAQALKIAVENAGVLTASPARATSPAGDVRAALMNLRSSLMGMLGGGDIAPVAPVTRRPPPPLRDAQPRGVRAEAPTLTDGGGREAGRTLLHQTDAALSRLKLTQLASQPADAARAAAAAPDFMVELPMVLGHELSLAQLRVQRDGKQKGKAGERGWRVRFAVSFSVIGEVGAQVSLMGKHANVVIWADEAATADALEAMLPELAPALAARGLDVGAVRLKRGVPREDEPAGSGRLMDRMG